MPCCVISAVRGPGQREAYLKKSRYLLSSGMFGLYFVDLCVRCCIVLSSYLVDEVANGLLQIRVNLAF